MFFLIPYLIFVVFSYSIYRMNNYFMKQSFEKRTSENMLNLGKIYRIALLNIIKENKKNYGEQIRKYFFTERDIAYFAVRKSKEKLLDWETKYEGFLPIFNHYPTKSISLRKIQTPIGLIYELSFKFPSKELQIEPEAMTLGIQQTYSLLAKKVYLRYFLLIDLLIAIIIFLYYLKIIKYNLTAINKEKKLLNEQRDKEYFMSLSTLSLGISHEIKNPLNTLSLIFENISLNKQKPKKIDPLIKEGKEEINRLIRLSNSFNLLLQKEKQDKSSWDIYRFDIAKIVDKSIKITKRAFSTKILFDIKIKEPLYIRGNMELTLLMLNNLLKNSCESSGTDGLVEVSLNKNDNYYLEIKDTGGGFKEKLEVLQKPFKTNKKGNLGIGLFIIKKVLDFHNWKLKILNNKVGTTFRIIFRELNDEEKN